MRITYNIITLLLAASVLTSCTRENEVLEPEVLPAGGKGGLIQLNITPQHHKKDINGAVVYIKYAATTSPSNGVYDDTAIAGVVMNRPQAIFTELTQGDYYIYVEGTDNTLEPGKDKITGDAHFRVVDTLAKTYDLFLQMDNPIHHKK